MSDLFICLDLWFKYGIKASLLASNSSSFDYEMLILHFVLLLSCVSMTYGEQNSQYSFRWYQWPWMDFSRYWVIYIDWANGMDWDKDLQRASSWTYNASHLLKLHLYTYLIMNEFIEAPDGTS